MSESVRRGLAIESSVCLGGHHFISSEARACKSPPSLPFAGALCLPVACDRLDGCIVADARCSLPATFESVLSARFFYDTPHRRPAPCWGAVCNNRFEVRVDRCCCFHVAHSSPFQKRAAPVAAKQAVITSFDCGHQSASSLQQAAGRKLRMYVHRDSCFQSVCDQNPQRWHGQARSSIAGAVETRVIEVVTYDGGK